jgi:hypothetical protein
VVVRRGRGAGHQMRPLGNGGDGDLVAGRHVGSRVRYGCHLRNKAVRNRETCKRKKKSWVPVVDVGVWVW